MYELKFLIILLFILIICTAYIYYIQKTDKLIFYKYITGGKDTKYKMSWNNSQEYTEEEAREFIQEVREDVLGFSSMTTERFKKLRSQINKKWSDSQIIVTWYMLSTGIAFRSYNRLGKIPNNILFNLNARDLVTTARRYRVPPLALAKRSLEIKGYTKSTIDKWANEPNSIWDTHVYDLIVKGWENDPENPTTTRIIFDKAREYEIEVEKMLKATGVHFKTQADLTEEQTEIYGRAVITPDFYFPKPITIIVTHPDGSVTDHEINWIDVKNYMFLGASFITKSIREQSEKYVAKFGPGALLFHYGFVNSMEFPGAVMLSGSEQNGFSMIP